MGSSRRRKQEPCNRQGLRSGIGLRPLAARRGTLLPAGMELPLRVTALSAKPRLRHRPRAMGAANGSRGGARGCLSSLLDCKNWRRT